MHSLMTLLKHYNVTTEMDDNQFKIICQDCNGFVTFSGRSGELIYIIFIRTLMYSIGIYLGDLVQENYYFKWPARTKTELIYKNILKEGNGDHKYLM